MKKFEEGVFSDLRNLKPGVDACLEEPKVGNKHIRHLSRSIFKPTISSILLTNNRRRVLSLTSSSSINAFARRRNRKSFIGMFYLIVL